MDESQTHVRVALITGASKGLGRSVARLLAKRGFALVIDARGAEDLAATRDELSRRAGRGARGRRGRRRARARARGACEGTLRAHRRARQQRVDDRALADAGPSATVAVRVRSARDDQRLRSAASRAALAAPDAARLDDRERLFRRRGQRVSLAGAVTGRRKPRSSTCRARSRSSSNRRASACCSPIRAT